MRVDELVPPPGSPEKKFFLGLMLFACVVFLVSRKYADGPRSLASV